MDGVNYPPPPDDEAAPRAGARWETVQHLYTVNSGSAPPANTLLVGELGLELADPVKIWAGVPTSMDATGRKLLYDSSKAVGAPFPEAPTDGLVYGRQGSTTSWLGVLPLTGGTLSGPLTIQSASNASFYVHATGPSWPGVKWNTELAGTAAGYFESQRYGLSRWSVEFGGTTRETGFNAGTDFLINRFDDSGNVLYPSPLAITRSDGSVHLGALVFLATDPTSDLMAATKHYVDQQSPAGKYLLLTGGTINPGPLNIENLIDNPRLNLTGLSGIGSYWPIVTLNVQAATGSVGIIQSQRNGARRWAITLGDGFTPEILGTTVGTDFIVSRYDDFGGLLGNVLTIARGSGNTFINAALTIAGTVILQAGDPTTDQGAATKLYVDNSVAALTNKYLPLTGGRLSGGLSFETDTPFTDPTNLTRHIALYDGWGGFSVTSGHLNIVAGTQLALSFDGPSIFVAPNTGLYVNRDPSTDMEVVNLRYLNTNTINVAGGDARWVNVTGDVMTGNLTVSTPSAATVVVNAAMGTSPGYGLLSGGKTRWLIAIDANLEDGSGFGSNLAFYSYHDDGSFGGTPLWIDRQDGYIWVGNTISVGRDPITNMEVVTLEYLRTNYAPIAGGGYVLKTGDTMTGPLILPGGSYEFPALHVTDASGNTGSFYIDATNSNLFTIDTNGYGGMLAFDDVNGVVSMNAVVQTSSNFLINIFSRGQVYNSFAWWSAYENAGAGISPGNGRAGDLTIGPSDKWGDISTSPWAHFYGGATPSLTVSCNTTFGGTAVFNGQARLNAGGLVSSGGIVFADVSGQSPADATRHIILHSGFGFGVTTPPASTPNRLNYIADVNSYHAFINGVDTLTIGSSGIQMAANTDVILSRVPTNSMGAVPKSYADGFLPLGGGVMTGGLVFNNSNYNLVAGRPDTSHHITLFSGYGFSITGGSLNIVTGMTTWFSNSQTGQDFAYFDSYGLRMVGNATVALSRDPTDKMDAVTKQYADNVVLGAGGPFLPIVAGFNNALTGELYLPHIAPTVDEMATPLFWVNGQIQSLQLQINQLEQNLVFVGQLDVPNDIVTFTPGFEISHPGYPSPGPLPDPSSLPKGYYVIVTVPGAPPPGSHIPPVYPPSTYTQHDWLISDGDVWVHLMLGLVYFTASQIAVLPQVYSGATTVQDTLQWLSDTKVNRAGDTMQGQLLLQFPTTDMSAVPWHTLVQQLGGYLALTGGNMLGGISFDGSLATGSSFTDNSRYLSLHPAGYGFNVTNSRLNYNVPADASHIFWVGGIMKFYTNVSGLTMTDGDLTLAHDPTSTMHATTKQYVDGRTPFTTDAPNDQNWYGRHAAQWGYVPGVQYIGAGAYNLNAVSPSAFMGILSITNQASAPNWPSDNPDQCAAVLHTFNSNAAWQGQLMMGGRQRGPQPALWYRSVDDEYPGSWSPWTRLIGSTGGTFLATVVFFANNTPGMVPVIVQGNGSAVTPAQNWGGAFQFNQSGGNSELDFINLFNNPGRSFSWWQMNTGGTALTEIGWFSPNGNFSVPTAVYTGSVHLSQTPTASDQAATLGQVNAVSASLGNYLPLVGGILTGNLTLNASWPTISLDTATGNGRQIMGFTSGSARWLLRIGDNDPESGNNLGASFALYRYGDGGGYLGMPFFISRQTGDASFQGTIFVGTDPTQNLAVATKQYVDAVRTALGGYLPLSGGALSGLLTAQAGISVTGGPFTVGWSGAGGAGMVLQAAPGAYRALIWETGGLQLWNIGNSSGEPRDGSNTGGDLAFYRFDDAGNFLSTPLMLMRASGAVMLDRDPSSNLQAATKQYVDSKTAGNYLPLTGGVLSGRLDISYTASTTSCQLFLAPANFSGNALEGKLRFGGTFGVGVGDIGVRLTSSIRSGFRSNAWGYEYLDVWINNGNPNDASSDINQVQVASFNRFGITMPASMAITLSADPTANLQAATKQYVDGIILRQGGPWLPLTGGQISGGLEVQGILEATSNSSVINGLGTWGLAITNNLTQGQGEVDFVSLYTPYGGFHWYQAQTGYVKADLMALYPNATLALWGLGIQYWGIPHGGNTVGFVWYGGWLNAYVDGSLIGFLMTSDTANSLYLALTGGTMQGMLYSNSGINFNNGAVSNPQDTSRGITLWGATSGGYGFCVTGNTLNYNTDVANDKHDFYAGSNLLFRIWGSNYVISNLPMSLQGWLAVGGTSSLGGAVTINAYTPGWGAFNFGQQLAITGPINNGIGICDSSGTKWVGIHNSGGALMFSGMPALTDTTTPPRQWLMLSDAGATVSQITGTQSGGGNSSAIRVVAAFNASYEWNETSAAVDTRKWDAIAGGGSLYFRVMSDDEATANAWLTVGRAGAASTSVYLGTPNGQVYFNNIVGPLHFGNRIAPNNDPANTSNHITLWDGGYGFSITGGTLNVVFGGTCMFLNNGQQQAYFSSSGLTLASGTTALLGRDPTAAMEAVTLQYFQAHGAPSGAYLPIDGSVAMTPGNLRLNAGATPPTARTITGQTAGVDEWCIFLGGMNHAPFAITKFIGTASYQPGISIDWTTLNVTLLGNLAVNKTQGTISVNDPGGAYAQLGAYPGGGTLSVYGSNSQITLANAGSGHVNAIVGYSGTTYQRWSIAMGNATPESGGGSNTGSDFSIARFSDTGVQLGTPFFINRATGNVTIGPGGLISQGTVSINASGYATLALNKGGITSGYSNQIVGYAVGKTRWIIAPGNTDPESTGNAGSNFAIYSYNDDGSYNASPFFINRATGATTVNSNLYAPYISCSGWIIGSNIIRSQGYSNPSVACYNLTGGYVSGMWCESGGTLSWGDCDGNGTPSNTRMYLDRSNNLTVAGGSFATYLHSSGETNTNTIMNASGVFYVANNYAYYLARDGGSGTWNFVENNQWNFAVRINGDIACRNSLYAYGGVFAQNDGGFGFYQNAGAQRQFAFAANWFWDWDGNNGTLYWYSAAFSGAHWYIRNDGWCFNNWFVVGGHGAYQDLSDERAKVDIMPSLAGLAEILQINPIRFRRVRNFKPKPKIDDYHDVGFSAQQVRGIIPEAVMVAGFELPGGGGTMDSANPSLSIGTTAIIAALVNSVKELTAMNAALAARVATLETRTLH